MRSLVGSLLAMVMIFALASIALARGAPDKKAFTAQAIVSVSVAPSVANVAPVTVGLDVIKNVMASSRFASVNEITDTSGAMGLSTTGDERGFVAGYYSGRTGSQLRIVLLT